MTGKIPNWSRRSVLRKSALATGAFIVGGRTLTGTAAAGIGDGRVAHYHLNNLNYDRDRGEIVAGHVHDASPENNHGEWWDESIDPVVEDGAVGNAFEFNGDDFVMVADDDSLNFGSEQDFTMAAFVRIPEEPENQLTIISKNDGGGNPRYLFKIDDDGTLMATITHTGGQIASGSTNLADGEWHHVAAVVDRDEDVFLFVDGDNKGATGHGTPDQDVDNEVDLQIGRSYRGYSSRRYFEGSLDQVRIYKRALSDGEIQELAYMAND